MTVGQQYTLYGNLICIKQVNMFFDKDFVDGMGIAEEKNHDILDIMNLTLTSH